LVAVNDRFGGIQEREMTHRRHPEEASPRRGEVEAMVAVLEGRHGVWAAEVAEFFSTFHSLKGDPGRSWAWAGVADLARRRASERLREQ
jgi:hypothetical protein